MYINIKSAAITLVQEWEFLKNTDALTMLREMQKVRKCHY